jgi:ribose-phosphate pyrophosphokinase
MRTNLNNKPILINLFYPDYFVNDTDLEVISAEQIHNLENIPDSLIHIIVSLDEYLGKDFAKFATIVESLKKIGKKIHAIIPFAPYSRHDQANSQYSAVMADSFPKNLKQMGIDYVSTIDIHSNKATEYYQKYFNQTVKFYSTTDLFYEQIKNFHITKQIVIGAPDGANKPHDQAQERGKNLAIKYFGQYEPEKMFFIEKRQTSTSTEIVNFIGNVQNKTCIIIDDIMVSGSTIMNAAKLLREKGAKEIIACVTHIVTDRKLLERIIASKLFNKLLVTDTISAIYLKNEKLPKNQNIMSIISIKTLIKKMIEAIK